MPTIPCDLLLNALVETLVMTAVSGAISILLGLPLSRFRKSATRSFDENLRQNRTLSGRSVGLPTQACLGLVLVDTAPGGLWESRALNRAIGAVVNGSRSVPFIILMVALIPLTRFVAGTSIGTTAAIVPLSIAAVPYDARVAQVSLREVDRGLVEAVKAMGGSQPTITRDMLIPEALPGLISGFTATPTTADPPPPSIGAPS